MNRESFGSFVPNSAKFGPWISNELHTVDRGRAWRVCFIFLPFLMNCYVSKPRKVSTTCALTQSPLLSKQQGQTSTIHCEPRLQKRIKLFLNAIERENHGGVRQNQAKNCIDQRIYIRFIQMIIKLTSNLYEER